MRKPESLWKACELPAHTTYLCPQNPLRPNLSAFYVIGGVCSAAPSCVLVSRHGHSVSPSHTTDFHRGPRRSKARRTAFCKNTGLCSKARGVHTVVLLLVLPGDILQHLPVLQTRLMLALLLT